MQTNLFTWLTRAQSFALYWVLLSCLWHASCTWGCSFCRHASWHEGNRQSKVLASGSSLHAVEFLFKAIDTINWIEHWLAPCNRHNLPSMYKVIGILRNQVHDHWTGIRKKAYLAFYASSAKCGTKVSGPHSSMSRIGWKYCGIHDSCTEHNTGHQFWFKSAIQNHRGSLYSVVSFIIHTKQHHACHSQNLTMLTRIHVP